MSNTNTKKTKLSTRILLIFLSALMVITMAVTTIYMIIETFTEDAPENNGTTNNGDSGYTEQDDKNQDHDHDHEDPDPYY